MRTSYKDEASLLASDGAAYPLLNRAIAVAGVLATAAGGVGTAELDPSRPGRRAQR